MKGEDKMKNIIRFVNGEDVDCVLNSPRLWYGLLLWFTFLILRDAYQIINLHL